MAYKKRKRREFLQILTVQKDKGVEFFTFLDFKTIKWQRNKEVAVHRTNVSSQKCNSVQLKGKSLTSTFFKKLTVVKQKVEH